jgi:hypothetical protein
MTVRDLSIFRLSLGFIFGDVECMELMMDRLQAYPLFDLPLVRQHLRMTFHGMSALKLGREKKNSEYTEFGKKIMVEVRKLDNIGSVNAHPIYLCLKAVEKHKMECYDDAILACSQANLMHLEAMMSEQGGMLLLKKGKLELGKEYLGRAVWLFNDWGATAKVDQLQERFTFLEHVPRKSVNRSSLTSLYIQSRQQQQGMETSDSTTSAP